MVTRDWNLPPPRGDMGVKAISGFVAYKRAGPSILETLGSESLLTDINNWETAESVDAMTVKMPEPLPLCQSTSSNEI